MSRRRRAAFTLIELLVVVVVIGILASLAIARFESTKGKANLATVKEDLHNLATAEEGYFYDSAKYTTSVPMLAFKPSAGNSFTVVEATNMGWSATATNPLSYPHFCAIFVGVATPIAPSTAAGAVACQ